MNALYQAAADLQAFVVSEGWPFCIIGGLAVQRWGVQRTTRDADMTVLTNFVNDEACISALLKRFPSRIEDPVEFARRARILLLRHENGVDLDVALGALEFEERAIQRASWWDSNNDARLFTCSAEDLVVYKAFASRDRDWADVESIIETQGKPLKILQILAEIGPLVEMKEDASIIPKLKSLLKKHNLH